MRRFAALALLPLVAAQAPAPAPPKKLTPNDVVNSAPRSAWVRIPAEDLLVMTLDGGGRVVVQLAPDFAPAHVANIRKLALSTYWQGASVYRVQDNYVAQWGLGEIERALPAGVVERPAHEYWREGASLQLTALGSTDPYASQGAGFSKGWPVARYGDGNVSLTHCYAMVGVARGLAPDTGSGGELYAIIGHAPRQLDRNIAIVGRVVQGIELLSSLPRGTEALGFYKKGTVAKPISSIALASALPEASRPAFEYLDERSPAFATYLKLRANRDDDFYRTPAGGVDLCNAPVPVRVVPAG
jgi:peptidylprolyl isomerase